MLQLSKGSQNNTIAGRQEIWVLLKMYAGSCQGNSFFLLFIRAQWVLPHSLLIFCLCARLNVHPALLEPGCTRVFVGAFAGACTLCSAWKGKRMRENWVSQEAGLESDLISLMCDQCEWEAGNPKASVATQRGRLQMCPRPQTQERHQQGGSEEQPRGFQETGKGKRELP